MGDTKLSKFLSYILRHKAVEEGFKITIDGYIKVQDILKHKQCLGYTENDIVKVVKGNDKQRFSLQKDPDGNLWIRANQGHSMAKTTVEVELKPVTNPLKYPIVVHGTYKDVIKVITIQGLSKCSRQHIHFSKGKNAISGARKNCNVFIYIDLAKALEDGYKFFESKNGVILCPGDENGYLPASYFSKIEYV
jgi:2'-phosphotransferase